MKRSLVCAGVGLLIAGCGLVGPEDEFEGTVLALTTVNDQVLPATVVDGDFTWIFVSDTIWLGDDDTWTRRDVRVIEGPGVERRRLEEQSVGFVVRDGDELVLDFECNDVIIGRAATCVAPDRLREADGGWEIASSRFSPDLRFVYAEVGPAIMN